MARPKPPRMEGVIERALLGTRWLLLPLYLALIVAVLTIWCAILVSGVMLETTSTI